MTLDDNGFMATLPRQLGVAVLLGVCYLVAVAIYRLYLSPLAKIPGPKLAALTSWYNAYYDLVEGGQYVWVVEEMHKKYGPIVRTRPDAVHINDVGFVDKLYSQSPKLRRERYWTVLNTLQADGSILATRDHHMHRKRRAVLNPFFSKENVRRLEPVINATLVDLLHRMERWAAASPAAPVQFNRPLRAATKDIIQAYAFGDIPGVTKTLEMEDCGADFFDIIKPQPIVHLGTHVYWLALLLNNLPWVIMKTLMPRIVVFGKFMEGLKSHIETVRAAKELPEGKTIFHDIMRTDTLPEPEKETQRLVDEAMVIVIAGSETTASTMAAIVYHLLADREGIMARLKAELAEAMPDSNMLPVASKLESLPFLNAVIQEALRLYPGATHRQDRIAPDEDLVFESSSSSSSSDGGNGPTYVIPRGYAMGMTAPILNRNRDVYGADADEFRPERYLENPGLGKYQFAFSRGTRQCIGINLAYQELQTLTAGIFRRYDAYDAAKGPGGQDGPTMELFETRREDIALHADYITPAQYEGSQGLRVIIRR